MATPTAEVGLKRVRFALDDDKDSLSGLDDGTDGQWAFLK